MQGGETNKKERKAKVKNLLAQRALLVVQNKLEGKQAGIGKCS